MENGGLPTGKIVAANIDGRTTLKRMVCPDGEEPCYLLPESTLPEFAGKMHPLNEITVLGVVVGKAASAAASGK